MGREIRRVPKGWEHPKNDRGHYEPLFDRTHTEAYSEWRQLEDAWVARDWERYERSKQ